MKILLIITVIASYILAPIHASAQEDVRRDLEGISRNYALQNHFTAGVTYALYINGKLESKETARIVRNDSLFKYTLHDLEIVNNAVCKLFINHISKEISVMPAEKIDNNVLFRIPLDSAIAESYKQEITTITETEGKIELFYNNTSYEKIEFFYTKATHKLKKLKIHFSPLHDFADDFGIGAENAGANLEFEIVLDSYVINPQADNTSFSETEYITVSGKKLSLSPKYKTYELYNFLFTE